MKISFSNSALNDLEDIKGYWNIIRALNMLSEVIKNTRVVDTLRVRAFFSCFCSFAKSEEHDVASAGDGGTVTLWGFLKQ